MFSNPTRHFKGKGYNPLSPLPLAEKVRYFRQDGIVDDS